jgi:hypothetical protein
MLHIFEYISRARPASPAESRLKLGLHGIVAGARRQASGIIDAELQVEVRRRSIPSSSASASRAIGAPAIENRVEGPLVARCSGGVNTFTTTPTSLQTSRTRARETDPNCIHVAFALARSNVNSWGRLGISSRQSAARAGRMSGFARERRAASLLRRQFG